MCLSLAAIAVLADVAMAGSLEDEVGDSVAALCKVWSQATPLCNLHFPHSLREPALCHGLHAGLVQDLQSQSGRDRAFAPFFATEAMRHGELWWRRAVVVLQKAHCCRDGRFVSRSGFACRLTQKCAGSLPPRPKPVVSGLFRAPVVRRGRRKVAALRSQVNAKRFRAVLQGNTEGEPPNEANTQVLEQKLRNHFLSSPDRLT